MRRLKRPVKARLVADVNIYIFGNGYAYWQVQGGTTALFKINKN